MIPPGLNVNLLERDLSTPDVLSVLDRQLGELNARIERFLQELLQCCDMAMSRSPPATREIPLTCEWHNTTASSPSQSSEKQKAKRRSKAEVERLVQQIANDTRMRSVLDNHRNYR